MIAGIRNLLFDFKILRSHKFHIPIISVGNISLGGTGKTPHVEYLIHLLKDEFKIATLSRGYKRKTKGFILSDQNASARQIGDEPMQMKRKFPEISVAVDANRVRGVSKLLETKGEKNPDVILLDDAYQHRYIKAGLSILLIDYNRPIGKDFLMPCGTLRESSSGRRRADIIIVSKLPENTSEDEKHKMQQEIKPLPHQKLYFTSFSYGNLLPVFSKETSFVNLDDWEAKKYAVLLFAGIANPKPFRRYLDRFASTVEEIYFPDHYNFSRLDMRKIEKKFERLQGKQKIILTTEKDATRIFDMHIASQNLRKHLFYIPISVTFFNNEKLRFNEQVLNYVRKNTNRH